MYSISNGHIFYTEEVLSGDGALWIAPDGSKLAIASFNDTEVDEMTYILYEDQYETEVALRYPKAGRKNPIVTLRYMSLVEPYTWTSVTAPINKVTEDHILNAVFWAGPNRLFSIWLNRRQNAGVLVSCDTATNECKEVCILAFNN